MNDYFYVRIKSRDEIFCLQTKEKLNPPWDQKMYKYCGQILKVITGSRCLDGEIIFENGTGENGGQWYFGKESYTICSNSKLEME